MTLNTYTGLKNSLLVWNQRSLNDQDFVSQIPTFIQLAEQVLFTDFPSLGDQFYVNGAFQAGIAITSKPALWGRTLSFFFLDTDKKIHFLQRRSFEMSLLYRDNYETQGLPLYYSDYGFNYMEVSPVPDQVYDFQLAYYGKIYPLTPQNQTNWLTLNAYDLLFSVCMFWANIYLQNPTEIEKWGNLSDRRLSKYTGYDQSRLVDRYADASTRLLSSTPVQGAPS